MSTAVNTILKAIISAVLLVFFIVLALSAVPAGLEVIWWKAWAVLVFSMFLPLSAYCYYTHRYKIRRRNIRRIRKILEKGDCGEVSEEDKKKDKKEDNKYEVYAENIKGAHFIPSVGVTTLITFMGLSLLFVGQEFRLHMDSNFFLAAPFLAAKEEVVISDVVEYQQLALLVIGMAFFGAYLWGIRNIYRRYVLNDLYPSTYYLLGIRMIFASTISLLVLHCIESIVGNNESMSGSMIPIMAFLVGMFPEQGLNRITNRLRFRSYEPDPSVGELPLEMIEGMTLNDKMRLQEQGIDTCYDLALADFIPLILKTPYYPRELINWILQAKLCVKFGSTVRELRQRGIRLITDLCTLTDDDIETFANTMPLTKEGIIRARREAAEDEEVARLLEVSKLLSRFWPRKE